MKYIFILCLLFLFSFQNENYYKTVIKNKGRNSYELVVSFKKNETTYTGVINNRNLHSFLTTKKFVTEELYENYVLDILQNKLPIDLGEFEITDVKWFYEINKVDFNIFNPINFEKFKEVYFHKYYDFYVIREEYINQTNHIIAYAFMNKMFVYPDSETGILIFRTQ